MNKNELKEIVKEVVAEERMNMFLEKNVPTNPSKWSYYKAQAKKKLSISIGKMNLVKVVDIRLNSQRMNNQCQKQNIKVEKSN